MFDIAGSDNQKSEPLKLSEPATTIELLLSYLDPTNLTRVINPITIELLLVAAHKYQMNGILSWFEHEVSIDKVDRVRSTTQEAFLFSHPALVLALAVRCDFEEVGKVALRELCGGDLKALMEVPLNGPITREIYRVREERIH